MGQQLSSTTGVEIKQPEHNSDQQMRDRISKASSEAATDHSNSLIISNSDWGNEVGSMNGSQMDRAREHERVSEKNRTLGHQQSTTVRVNTSNSNSQREGIIEANGTKRREGTRRSEDVSQREKAAKSDNTARSEGISKNNSISENEIKSETASASEKETISKMHKNDCTSKRKEMPKNTDNSQREGNPRSNSTSRREGTSRSNSTSRREGICGSNRTSRREGTSRSYSTSRREGISGSKGTSRRERTSRSKSTSRREEISKSIIPSRKHNKSIQTLRSNSTSDRDETRINDKTSMNDEKLKSCHGETSGSTCNPTSTKKDGLSREDILTQPDGNGNDVLYTHVTIDNALDDREKVCSSSKGQLDRKSDLGPNESRSDERNKSNASLNVDSLAIGIDLGTSKFCVAVFQNEQIDFLKNEFDQRTTPSCVAFTKQQRVVGSSALDQSVMNMTNTICSVKRVLGRSSHDIDNINTGCEAILHNNNSKSKFPVQYKNEARKLNPEQITAMLLTKSINIAENALACTISQAVVSVPACFSNTQRKAVLQAAKIAGLEVLQLINETTAAGIAFEYNRSSKTCETIAVVDFGAGKLEVSILHIGDGEVKVLAAAGTPYIGGCDIDNALATNFIEVIKEKYNLSIVRNSKEFYKLLFACEKLKRNLSLLQKSPLIVDSLCDDIDVKIPFTQENLNDCIVRSICQRLSILIEELLIAKQISKDQINKVLLVGGSVRIPAVKTLLSNFFGKEKIDETVNQEEAVAQGAAILAASYRRTDSCSAIKISEISSCDITRADGAHLIESFTRIPYEAKINNMHQDDRYCLNKLYERVKDREGNIRNEILLNINFNRLIHCSRPAGIVSVDKNGIFNFSVVDKGMMVVDSVKYVVRDNPKRMERWVAEENEFRDDIALEHQRVEAEVALESLCMDLYSRLQDKVEIISEIDRTSWSQKCDEVQDWLQDNFAPTLEDMEKQKQKLMEIESLLNDSVSSHNSEISERQTMDIISSVPNVNVESVDYEPNTLISEEHPSRELPQDGASNEYSNADICHSDCTKDESRDYFGSHKDDVDADCEVQDEVILSPADLPTIHVHHSDEPRNSDAIKLPLNIGMNQQPIQSQPRSILTEPMFNTITSNEESSDREVQESPIPALFGRSIISSITSCSTCQVSQLVCYRHSQEIFKSSKQYRRFFFR